MSKPSLSFAGDLTIRTEISTKEVLRNGISAGEGSVKIEIQADHVANLTFVQLLLAAQRANPKIGLAQRAHGSLWSVLERGGFLELESVNSRFRDGEGEPA